MNGNNVSTFEIVSRQVCICSYALVTVHNSFNQSMKFISNQIKKLDIQCTLYNIHGRLFYNKHVTTFSLSD